MFRCKATSCCFETNSAPGYLNHCRVHSNLSSITCGVENCRKTFRTQSTFHCHVSRCHGLLRNQKKQAFLQNVGINVKCNVEGCQKVCPFDELIKHLKGHIDCGMKIQCPVQECGRIMSKKSTFTAHISVKHGTVNKVNINQSMVEDVDSFSERESQDTTGHALQAADSMCSHGNIGHDVEVDNGIHHSNWNSAPEVEVDNGVQGDAFLHNLSLFFLRLQCKFNVPVSTIEVIAKEMNSLHAMSMETYLKSLKIKLVEEGTQPLKVENILCELRKEDFLSAALNADDGPLRSHYKRCLYYKENLKYVEPV
jgi:uncharacterized C2H2 Zn-finger protein